MTSKPAHTFSVAPMIDWTDRHCRFFHRCLTKNALLYTEMIVADAILRGDQQYLLGFNGQEHPVALQLGGSDPAKLAKASKIGEQYGYDEINLNVGCPSDRVQSGTFGACLMKTPELVADCISAMQQAVSIPVTVKCRIGVDDQIPEESLFKFIDVVSKTGCTHFIVHARKAWLEGLSPKENRTIPPLDYGLVQRLKKEKPDLTIVLNGGITAFEKAKEHLRDFDGVMLGRAAYENPYLLADVDGEVFGDKTPKVSREQVINEMTAYLEKEMANGMRAHNITRHMLGLFHGQAGARKWRQYVTVEAVKPSATPKILEEALDYMRAVSA